MKHVEYYKTTWHDTDCRRTVRPSSVLTYFEETSNRHMIAVGQPLDKVRDEAGLGFVLSRIVMKFYRPLEAYKEITVETWTSEGRAFSTFRNFRLAENGEIVAEALSVWALVDVKEHKPVKISSYDFGFEHEAPLQTEATGRVTFPKEVKLEKVGSRHIFFSDCDYNMHMNNTRYPDMICDFLPEPSKERPTAMTLSFVHEAAINHTVDVYRAKKSDKTYVFRTVDSDGITCLEAEVVVE